MLILVSYYLDDVGCVMVTADSLEVEPHSRLKMFDGHTVLTLSPHVQHIPPLRV